MSESIDGMDRVRELEAALDWMKKVRECLRGVAPARSIDKCDRHIADVEKCLKRFKAIAALPDCKCGACGRFIGPWAGSTTCCGAVAVIAKNEA